MRQRQKHRRPPNNKLTKDKIILAGELDNEKWWLREIEAVDSLTLHFKATHKTSAKK